MLTHSLIEQILTTIPHRRVGLLGDLFLDRYLDIDSRWDEPSIETGLTAFQVVGVRSYPGALGTVMNNLSALGVGHIYPIAAIGDDGEGYELRQALEALPGYAPGGVFPVPGRRTPTYCKPMRDGIEWNRFDIKNRTPTPAQVEDMLWERLEKAWPQLDALIVLDQVSEADCGVVTSRVRERLAALAGGDPTRFVLADSRERIHTFQNVHLKPNQQEWSKGHVLHAPKLGRTVFLTQGENGITVMTPEQTILIPAYPVTGPIDICGAGDSCSAGIVSAVVAGLSHEQAAAFGNLIASITVQQIGTTGTATPEQVRRRWQEIQG
ncbi:MAG: PfkB family carbohydrate kinase [Bacteroidales bacterium]|nr:PfkB family carbohydrate kinase [Bacteroidales bacterium]